MFALYDLISEKGQSLDLNPRTKSLLERLLEGDVEGLLDKSQEADLYKNLIEEIAEDKDFMIKLKPYLSVFTKDLNKPVTED